MTYIQATIFLRILQSRCIVWKLSEESAMNKNSKKGKRIAGKISNNTLTPEELLEEIVKNYKKNEFSIDKYCRENNVNHSTITTQFTKSYSFCPSIFLENLRIEDYLFMLWQPDIKIEGIGAKSGFGNSRRARRVLKKRLSCSPSVCRNYLLEKIGETKMMNYFIKLIWNGNRPDELLGSISEHFDRQIEFFHSLLS